MIQHYRLRDTEYLFLDILLVRHYGYMGIAYAKLLVVMLGSLSLIILYRHALKKKTQVGS